MNKSCQLLPYCILFLLAFITSCNQSDSERYLPPSPLINQQAASSQTQSSPSVSRLVVTRSVGDYDEETRLKKGRWVYYNANGEKVYATDYTINRGGRIGAICMDGWRSHSTGRGTCSWHGGVDYWLHDYYNTEQRIDFISTTASTASSQRKGESNYSYQSKQPSSSTDQRVPIEYRQLMQILPNADYDFSGKQLNWSYRSKHTSKVGKTINVRHNDQLFKLFFLSNREENDRTEYIYGMNTQVSLLPIAFINDKMDPGEPQIIGAEYPFIPIYDDIEYHSSGNRDIILFPNYKYQFGVFNSYLDVYYLEAAKLRLIKKGIPVARFEEDSSEGYRYSYRLKYDRPEIYLELTKMDDQRYTNEKDIYRFTDDDLLSIDTESMPIKDTLPVIQLEAISDGHKDWMTRIKRYHRLLAANDWSTIESLYTDYLQQYYDQGPKGVGEVLDDHRSYASKYEIDRQDIQAAYFQVDSTAIGCVISYPMKYEMISKSSGRHYSYDLSWRITFNHDNKITSVNSVKLENGFQPQVFTRDTRKSDFLNEFSTRVLLIDYHDMLRYGDYLSAMNLYDEKVNYHDKGTISHETILQDHAEYFGKYQVVSYNIIPDSWYYTPSSNGIKASYKMNYILHRRSDGRRLSFDLANETTLNNQGKITKVSSSIERRY